MKIPTLDLTSGIDSLWDEFQEAITGVLKSGQFIMGPNVSAFEKETADYLGVKHAISVNSGTDALLIALRAAGIGPGDEVITSPYTFFATAEAISQLGAKPVFVDIDSRSYNIDTHLIEQAINSSTRAILPVHIYGHAAGMDAIMKLAQKYELKVIEDTAQAFGGEYQGRKLGSIGDIGCFSFFPSKNLGAFGDGGLIATNNDELARTAGMLRIHGAAKKYFNEMIGYNSRLDEIQAAILRVKLPYVDRWNEARRQQAELYNLLLQDLSDIVIPYEAPCVRHVYHQYTIRVLQGKRDNLRCFLLEQGIETSVYYPVPLHKLPVYFEMYCCLNEAERAAKEVISLPMWPQMPAELVEKVCRIIRIYVRA